jgi:Xaa-Pro aminopeptidase
VAVVADVRQARREALLTLLDEEGLDGLIVSHIPNIRYLTSFSGSAGIALILRQESVFLSDFRYRTQAEQEIGDTARIEIVESDIWARVWQVLRGYNVERLGFEGHAVYASQAAGFEREAQVALHRAGLLVERLRASKDKEEVAAVRSAAQLAHEALAATLETVRVGQRELDVAASLESELRVRGSEWHPFPTIVASGPRSALPHAVAGTREIRAGDLLLLDFGATVDGYCADITRTVVVGAKADERQRTVYELVREAQQQALLHLEPGMSGKEGDALARSLIEERGFGDAFGHSLGHGLGLEVHEDPRVSRTDERPLPVNSIVTIEPGIYLAGWGGVRIEDDVFLGTEGTELLSDGDSELRELT